MPVARGAITEFPRDPIGTMKHLHARHGKLAMLSDAEASLVFGFGGEYNQRLLSDTQTFHSQFFADSRAAPFGPAAADLRLSEHERRRAPPASPHGSWTVSKTRG